MLELDENGKIVNRTDKTVDELKRSPYKHSALKEEDSEEVESFADSLEELEDGEDSPPEADLDPDAVEVAVAFAEFKANFVSAFGEGELSEAFADIEDFFSSKGVTLDMSDLTGDEEEDIPGMESSEQSIVTSEIEEE